VQHQVAEGLGGHFVAIVDSTPPAPPPRRQGGGGVSVLAVGRDREGLGSRPSLLACEEGGQEGGVSPCEAGADIGGWSLLRTLWPTWLFDLWTTAGKDISLKAAPSEGCGQTFFSCSIEEQ